MKTFRILCLSFLCLATMSASKCQDNSSKEAMNKIEFDPKTVDERGLLNGTVAIDYEFCIPKDENKVEEIESIVADVKIPRMAKGRVGCTDDQWLCIVTTNNEKWKEQLMSIAALPYVKRIVQTHYE